MRQEIDRLKAFNQTAQVCSTNLFKIINDESKKCSGQSMSSYSAYAQEEAHGDLNILFCCLQLQPHVKTVVLLTNDYSFGVLAKNNDVVHCLSANINKYLTSGELPDVAASSIKQYSWLTTDYDALENLRISVTGYNDVSPPPSVTSFLECDLHPKLLFTVANIVNYKQMTPVQKYGIPIIIAGHNAIIYSHTGSGKTATYLLPIIDNIMKNKIPVAESRPVALILSPTRELAVQVRIYF